MNRVRTAVSRKKKRYVDPINKFDLDLSYITSNIIAMGFPSDNFEGIYRNQMSEVTSCAERKYNETKFHGRVVCFPFFDHNPPPFTLIGEFCKDAQEWLKQHPKNIVVVHCKAGKGRTGVMIAALLLHCGYTLSTNQALSLYASERTYNSEGVTIPSQLRYVSYYNQLVKEKLVYSVKSLKLVSITVLQGKHYFYKDLFYKIIFGDSNGFMSLHNSDSSEVKLLSDVQKVFFVPNTEIILKGDIKIALFAKDKLRKLKLCHFWFNTFFVSEMVTPSVSSISRRGSSDQTGGLESGPATPSLPSQFRLSLNKSQLDILHKDSHDRVTDSTFRIQLDFIQVVDLPGIQFNTVEQNLCCQADDDEEEEDDDEEEEGGAHEGPISSLPEDKKRWKGHFNFIDVLKTTMRRRSQ